MTTYLVTGGAGFIGSYLSKALLARGDSVTVLDDLSTGQLSNLDEFRYDPRFRFVQGSILDLSLVDEIVSECDIVAHLAAAVGVKLIVEKPLSSLTTNIRGSENVLEAACRYGRKILLTSTSETYGKARGPLSEMTDQVIGSPSVSRWAYAVAKTVDETLAFAYHRERGLPIVVVRLFNTVGPRQSPAFGMVIPRLVRQALSGEPMTVYGDGRQSRCFCHVSDVVAAMLGLLDDVRAIGEVFNIGSTEEISILELAEKILNSVGGDSSIELVPYDQAYEVGFEDVERRIPDTSKLQGLIGWSPTLSLNDILEGVVASARTEREVSGAHSGVGL